MDEDIVARMVAVLCASIMAAAAGDKDHGHPACVSAATTL
jgi:hypothetical protein